MSNRTIKRHTLEQVMERLGYYEDSDIRSNYSGRAMYGSECAAVCLDSERDAYMLFAILGQAQFGETEIAEEADAGDLAKAARTDSMGRGIVLYWPGWTLVE